MVEVSLKLRLSDDEAIGPGKIRLLELLNETGSISAAGRAMDMSYRRAWLLIDELNRTFREPVAVSRMGGRDGGGAALTPFGTDLVRHYRAIESRILTSSQSHLNAIAEALPERRKPARR
jgi:molybdate transport system regulatory protein